MLEFADDQERHDGTKGVDMRTSPFEKHPYDRSVWPFALRRSNPQLDVQRGRHWLDDVGPDSLRYVVIKRKGALLPAHIPMCQGRP